MKLKTTVVFKHLQNSFGKVPIIALQGGTRCFTGSTLVQTSKGHVSIKDINKGDLVLSLGHKGLIFNKVKDKFIYKKVHTLIRLNYGNKQIVCTPDHKFYSEGQWIEAQELARRSLEVGGRLLQNKQQRKIEDYELEAYRKGKADVSCNERWLCKNTYNSKRKAKTNFSSSFSSRRIYSKTPWKSRGKPYRWRYYKQRSRKLGMVHSLGKRSAFLQIGFTKTTKRCKKRNEQINRTKSSGNKRKVCSKSLYGKNTCKRVWRISCNDKRHSLQKKDLEARCLNPCDITSFEILKKNCAVYDLEVENNANYCITRDNIIVHNSGKSYNILNWIIFHCITDWKNEIIDIGRKSFPSLRASIMFDFFEILKAHNLYNITRHNKSEHIYNLNGNIIRFFSIDQETKIRGSKRSILFMNEANEFKHDDFRQLNQRTTKFTILDYNPSDEFHWIYENVLTREDVDFSKTTFRDNPFLDERIRKEIYSYKDKDPNYWRIYGLGERGLSEATIYTHWKETDNYEGEGQEFFGLDFGFNDPTVLVRTKYHPTGGIVTEELLYKANLTSDLIIHELEKLEAQGKLSKTSTIIADSARPEIIAEIRRAGFNCRGAKKEKGSILRDINFIKKHYLFVVNTSVNMIKEVRSYKWKTDKDGNILDAPVDLNDHSLDSLRYSLNIVSHKDTPKPSRLIFGTNM